MNLCRRSEGYVKLLKGRPKVVNYIHKLMYEVYTGLFPDNCVSTLYASSYHRPLISHCLVSLHLARHNMLEAVFSKS